MTRRPEYVTEEQHDNAKWIISNAVRLHEAFHPETAREAAKAAWEKIRARRDQKNIRLIPIHTPRHWPDGAA